MSATEIAALLARTNALDAFDFEAADVVLRNSMALARHLFGRDSPHVAELEHVLFQPDHISYHTGHPMNQAHWTEGVEKLRRVLSAMDYELKFTHGKLIPPENVTLRWLFHHLSVRGWLFGLSVLAGAFSLGFFLGRNDAIARFVEFINRPL